MRSILEQLTEWAERLPLWQQIAFEKILSKPELCDTDYEEIFDYFLQESKLMNNGSQPYKPRYPRSNLQVLSKSKTTLQRLSNLKNINALVTEQALTFDPNLTVIFGANGSGKSGYARLLACSAFTRGDKEVLPDMAASTQTANEQSAELETLVGEKPQSLQIKIGNEPVLNSFYVFDSTSVRRQLTEENTFSFCPTNLDSLTELSNCIAKIQQRLRIKIEERTKVAEELFCNDPLVLEFFSSSGSDLQKIDEYVGTRVSDEKELEALEIRIARLNSDNRAEEIQELKRNINDIRSLRMKLKDVEGVINEKNWTLINQTIAHYASALQKSNHINKERFRTDLFRGVASEEWNAFIKAAQALARLEKGSPEVYPDNKDSCLFCHQELSDTAKELIQRYWLFLGEEDEKALETLKNEIEFHLNQLRGINLEFLSDGTAAYRLLESEDKVLLAGLIQYIEQLRKSVDTAVSTLAEGTDLEWSAHVSFDADLERFVQSLHSRVQVIETQDPREEMERLETRREQLNQRILLASHAAQLKEWVEITQWVEKAEEMNFSTRNITAKYKELFEHLVADRYIELFEETLKGLGRTLNVKVVTKGKKGESIKKLCLTLASKVGPDRVLSEGEKRAAALADFLTEVMLDENSSGIILDDPVTSLDWEWKQAIAGRIVAEAKHRQVIVFTHDLHFLYLVRNLAKESDIQPMTHWIKRGTDNRPGYVFLNNCPSLEEEYKDATKARKFHSLAVNTENSPEEQERLLRDGFGALRTSYEAFVTFELFNGVVRRFEERISMERLKDVVIKPDVVQRIIEKVGLLSRYIEGHLHRDDSSQTPTAKLLFQEIEAFEKLRSEQKVLKKDSQRSPSLSVLESAKAAKK